VFVHKKLGLGVVWNGDMMVVSGEGIPSVKPACDVGMVDEGD
jgi:hypothetical protein